MLRELQNKAFEERSKRDEYNLKVRELSAKIRELRDNTRELSSKIRELVEKRRQLIEEIRKLREEARKIREEIKKLKTSRKMSISKIKIIHNMLGRRIIDEEKLREELERLEWEYQTSTLPLEVEKLYVQKINDLELKLALANIKRNLSAKIDELNNEINKRIDELKKIKDEISKISEEISNLSSKIDKLREERDNLRNQLVKLKEQRDSYREKANECHNNYIKLLSKMSEIKSEIERLTLLIKASRIARSLKEQRKVLESKAKEIFERYKRGDRLTLEEFKLLVEFGYIDTTKR